MAAEKQFETKVKKWLESEGIYPLGTSSTQMNVPPCGYYEKRWGELKKAGVIVSDDGKTVLTEQGEIVGGITAELRDDVVKVEVL